MRYLQLLNCSVINIVFYKRDNFICKTLGYNKMLECFIPHPRAGGGGGGERRSPPTPVFIIYLNWKYDIRILLWNTELPLNSDAGRSFPTWRKIFELVFFSPSLTRFLRVYFNTRNKFINEWFFKQKCVNECLLLG